MPTEPFYVVLGGKQPGITRKMPFMASGRQKPTFPIVVKCINEYEANEIARAQDTLEQLGFDNSDIYLAQGVFGSNLINGLLKDGKPFYPIYSGGTDRVILRNYNNDVLPQINGSDFPIFRRTETFRDALVYMILRGRKNELAAFAFQPTPTSSFRIPIGSPARPPPRAPTGAPSFGSTAAHPGKQKSRTPATASTTPPSPSPMHTPLAGSRHGHETVDSSPSGISTSSITITDLEDSMPSLKLNSESLKFRRRSRSQDTPVTPRRLPIYQYVRNIGGVVDILHEPATRKEDPPPSLGKYVDKYLFAHGYQSASVWTISRVFDDSSSAKIFADAMVKRGMARLEACWLWDMLMDAEFN